MDYLMNQELNYPQDHTARETTMPNYIHLDFEDARLAKWEHGKCVHRKFNETDFVGDPLEELFQEFLDAYSYVLVLETRGVEMPGFRTIIKNMALSLQERRRELTKRI